MNENNPWKTISYIFHPVFMPTLGIIVVMLCDPFIYLSLDSPEPWITLISSMAVSTLLMPLFLSWVLLKAGRITSIKHPTEKDRQQLIAFSELCFLLAYISLHNIPSIGKSLSYFMLGVNIAMIITLITNMFTKVSLHAVGAGGILGTVIGLMYYTRMDMVPWVCGAIAMVVLVGYARYRLKAHEPGDIYIGLIIGIACQAAVFIIGGR